MNLNNLLITGATSYLGRNFLQKNHKLFKNIYAIIRSQSSTQMLSNIPNIIFLKWEGDIEKIKILQFQTVLHMATC